MAYCMYQMWVNIPATWMLCVLDVLLFHVAIECSLQVELVDFLRILSHLLHASEPTKRRHMFCESYKLGAANS